jgi:aspartyl-tRNA(Asn)/glutamyl-tRNA(Gln) amidotransferase subunit A
MTDLCDRSIVELADLIRLRDVRAIEATDAALDRIESLDPALNAFATVTAERARARAQDLDAELDRGSPPRPLHGVPVSLKDNLLLAGVKATAGSPLLDGWIPERSAAAADRLEAAGAVVVGKANLWEFAYGAPSRLFGRALNPWAHARSSGASSSGSAVAVATGMCAASLGTDSGGSIRIPAAFCGVVGLKPTHDLVARDGAIPVSETLDHVGPLARTAEDAAAVLAALADVRPEERPLAGATIGVPARTSLEPLAAEVAEALDAAIEVMTDAGASVAETGIPDVDEGCDVKWTISGFEAARHHDEQRYGAEEEYDEIVWHLLELGRAISQEAYKGALRRRAELRDELEGALATVDALVLPATPFPPTRLEEEDGPTLQATTRFTGLFNVTGSPALAVPACLSRQRLPVGIQLVGRAGFDGALLALGAAFEQARGPLPRPVVVPPREPHLADPEGRA